MLTNPTQLASRSTAGGAHAHESSEDIRQEGNKQTSVQIYSCSETGCSFSPTTKEIKLQGGEGGLSDDDERSVLIPLVPFSFYAC